jgi:hypothetical protein
LPTPPFFDGAKEGFSPLATHIPVSRISDICRSNLRASSDNVFPGQPPHTDKRQEDIFPILRLNGGTQGTPEDLAESAIPIVRESDPPDIQSF